jgi:DNA-directed RNA polymerase specialized sigma24 family protein
MSTFEAVADTDLPSLPDALGRQVALLPPMQQRAFRMREFEGREPPEICAALGVTESHLDTLLHAARLALVRALFGPRA